jgi:hypothetical protein
MKIHRVTLLAALLVSFRAALQHRAIARQLIFELARLAGSVAALPANIILRIVPYSV